jgi:hypothetical protein
VLICSICGEPCGSPVEGFPVVSHLECAAALCKVAAKEAQAACSDRKRVNPDIVANSLAHIRSVLRSPIDFQDFEQ